MLLVLQILVIQFINGAVYEQYEWQNTWGMTMSMTTGRVTDILYFYSIFVCIQISNQTLKFSLHISCELIRVLFLCGYKYKPYLYN